MNQMTRRNSMALTAMLTLTELHQRLQERGVQIAYSSLSALIAGEIAELLQAGKGFRGRMEFLPETVDVLAAFLPHLQEKREKEGFGKGAAPSLLRAFLGQKAETGTEIAIPLPGASEVLKTTESQQLAIAQGRAQGLAQTEEVLNAKEAAALLGISVTLLRSECPAWKRFGKSARGDRWRRSDLLA